MSHSDLGDKGELEALEERPIAVDELFEVLSRPQRRACLWYLENDGTASVDELAEWLAGQSHQRPAEEFARTLHHVHLPKLDEFGLIAYDQETMTATPDTDLTGLSTFISPE